MTSLFSSTSLPPPTPLSFTDEGTKFITAISSNGETSGTTTSSSSSLPSFLDPFNIFASPPSASLPPSPPPLHSATNAASHPYERRKHSSSSPGSAVLLLVGLTGGISLLASSSTFLLLRRSLATSVAQKINQRTERTLEEIRSSLLRVEGRLGALEGRIRSGKGARGLGGGQGEGGAGGGQLSSQILLSDLKEEVRAMKRDMEKSGGEMEERSSGLRDDGEGRAKVADVSWIDLRARSPYDFIPPSHSALETSVVVSAPTVASPPPFTPATVDPIAEQLIELVRGRASDAPSSTSVSDQVKVALETKRSKLEGQSAKIWKQAFDKGRSSPPPPPLVRVKGSDRVWEDAFRIKHEDFDATNAVEPAKDVISTEFKEVEAASNSSSSSLDQIEDDQATQLSSNASSSSVDSLPSTTVPSNPTSTFFITPSTSAPTTGPEPPVTSSPTDPPPLDTAPLLEPTPPLAPTTTLGKDLDLAASLASRIDSHWYSSISSSQETTNIKPEAQGEEPPVVDKTKSRKTRARPFNSPTVDTASPSSSPPSTSIPTTSSGPPPSPKSTHDEEPTTMSSTFHFGAATTFVLPGIGFAGVYSSPPLRFLSGDSSSSTSSGPAFGANATSEEKSTRSRTRGSKIIDDVTLEGYDRNGALFRSFRRRFL